MQLELVDMNDPDMDPMEWSVRHLVPIPKKYYWETNNLDLSLRTKLWHRTVSALGSALRCAECIGEIVANIVGLNSSSYDYVISTMTPDQWEASRRNAQEIRAKRDSYREDKKKTQQELHLAQDVGLNINIV